MSSILRTHPENINDLENVIHVVFSRAVRTQREVEWSRTQEAGREEGKMRLRVGTGREGEEREEGRWKRNGAEEGSAREGKAR